MCFHDQLHHVWAVPPFAWNHKLQCPFNNFLFYDHWQTDIHSCLQFSSYYYPWYISQQTVAVEGQVDPALRSGPGVPGKLLHFTVWWRIVEHSLITEVFMDLFQTRTLPLGWTFIRSSQNWINFNAACIPLTRHWITFISLCSFNQTQVLAQSNRQTFISILQIPTIFYVQLLHVQNQLFGVQQPLLVLQIQHIWSIGSKRNGCWVKLSSSLNIVMIHKTKNKKNQNAARRIVVKLITCHILPFNLQ